MNQPTQTWPADREAELERPMKPQSKPSRNRDAKKAGLSGKAGKDKGRTVRRDGRASRYLPVGKDDWLDRARGLIATGKPQFVLVQNGDAPPYLAHVTARSGDTITTSVGTFKDGKHICQPDGSWRIVDGDAADHKKVYFRWRGKADWSEDIYRTIATDKTPEHQWEVVGVKPLPQPTPTFPTDELDRFDPEPLQSFLNPRGKTYSAATIIWGSASGKTVRL